MSILSIPQRTPSAADPPAVETKPFATATYQFSAVDDAGHVRKMDDIEIEIVRFAISRYKGQVSEVARRLGIGRSTLYRKLKERGLASAPAEDEPRKAVG